MLPEKKEQCITDAIRHLEEKKQSIIERKEANKPTPEKMAQITIGAIFDCAWGYGQTNRDFYQVVGIKNTTLTLRKIGSKQATQTSHDSAKVIALPDQFCGDPFNKRVTFVEDKPSLKLSSFEHAFLWCGKPVHCSWGY